MERILIIVCCITVNVYAHDTFVEVQEAWGIEIYKIEGCDQKDLEVDMRVVPANPPFDTVTKQFKKSKGYCLRQPIGDEPSIGIVIRKWEMPTGYSYERKVKWKLKRRLSQIIPKIE